jgi:hypothetical protein
VDDVAVHAPSLDDVFFALTGTESTTQPTTDEPTAPRQRSVTDQAGAPAAASSDHLQGAL